MNINLHELNEIIVDVELQIIKMEDDINKLWDNVIVPYIDDSNAKGILTKITKYDYHKFYKFMINSNKTCIELNNAINNLYEMRNKLSPFENS